MYKATNKAEAWIYGFKYEALSINEKKIGIYFGEYRANRPSIVLIHGFSATASVWFRCAAKMKSDFNVIIPELPGHGNSGYDKNARYSSHEQASTLYLAMMKLRISRVSIAGNSMGGFIASRMAIDYPELIDHLILVNPVGISSSPKQSKMDRMLGIGKNPFLINTHQEFESFFKMVMYAPPFFPHIIRSGLSRDYIRRRKELEHIYNDYSDKKDFLDNSLMDIKARTLFIFGVQDEIVDKSCEQSWKKIPMFSSILLEDVGHMPMLEAPARTKQLIAGFLNEE
ncbi:alpha/beta fold hydrolase [Ningiella sp. W23]|uniref:alpha/beta fold hydrolase n=1 Tax=Ningiella sp. W23 TaxID=3023715 RepID=UPI0039F5A8C1